MHAALFDSPPLVFALAMLAGVLAQALGRHALVPGIVVLLGVGVLLGPDTANLIRPDALGGALDAIVGFAVAVILFEGGMRLDLGHLRKQAKIIRRLVLWGSVLTTVGGTLACKLILGWDWRISILFGTLVIVTGPTVVGPLVRRIRLAPSLGTILEAEGVFIDAVGATIAIMALEVAVEPSGETLGVAALGVITRLGVGAAIGIAGGLALGALLRVPRLVPRGIENILALSTAVAVFELSHAVIHESGIPAAVACGLVVGNMRIQRMSELVEFKEQLTVLLIGTLFVLLAADVRLADVGALGWNGLWVVAVLSLIVRPLTVLACTFRTGHTWRERLFLSWVAPRGIVAAAVASLFAVQLAAHGVPAGVALRALVFTVIAVTVTVQGLTAGPLASVLGLRRKANTGVVFLGANPLARHLARRLVAAGETVELIDTNPDDCRLAEEAGLKVVYGNGLEPRTLSRARAELRARAVGVTTNESVNLLFARRVLESFTGPVALVAVDPRGTGINPQMVADAGARVVFGRAVDLQGWIGRWRQRHVETARYRWSPATDDATADPLAEAPDGAVLPLLVERKGQLQLIDDTTRLRAGDVVELAIATDRRDAADPYLARPGWQSVAAAAAPPPGPGKQAPSAA
jgi:NhaP-type Na+/H+ or K+/H+ antiporter